MTETQKDIDWGPSGCSITDAARPVTDQLKGGLVASCQPVENGPMNAPEIVAAMARAAVAGGAKGLRIEGVENLRAVRVAVAVPIIGIVKGEGGEDAARITLRLEDVDALVATGADVVAFDATCRPRATDRAAILARILEHGVPAMADCSTCAEAKWAASAGAAILGTTLSGYTPETRTASKAPDLALVRAFRELGRFVMAEGRFDTPELAAAAIANGADAVTVGSVLTRLEVVTGRFTNAVRMVARVNLYGFAVDLGGTKTAAAEFRGGRLVQSATRPTDGGAGPAEQVGHIGKLLYEIGYERGAPLAVALTGRIDQSGCWHAVNRETIGGISSAPIADMITAEFGTAHVMNDAAAATLADHRLGSGIGHDNFAFVTVSTGVGGGLVLNGRLHQSPDGIAGHIGFTTSRFATETCGSGRFGTVESLAGGRAIARAGARFESDVTSARDVFDRARQGAGWADGLIDISARAIAELAGNLVATLGITRIALGGSIGLADGYIERVERELGQLPGLFRCEIVPAALAAEGPLIGALLASGNGQS